MIRRVSQDQFTALCDKVIGDIKKENGKPIVIVIADEAGDIIHMRRWPTCAPGFCLSTDNGSLCQLFQTVYLENKAMQISVYPARVCGY